MNETKEIYAVSFLENPQEHINGHNEIYLCHFTDKTSNSYAQWILKEIPKFCSPTEKSDIRIAKRLQIVAQNEITNDLVKEIDSKLPRTWRLKITN